MKTYAIRCQSCGEWRWPTLLDRPRVYTCARCAAVEPSKLAARRESAAKAQKSRRGTPGDAA